MEKGDVVSLDYTGRVKESQELFDTTLKDVAEEENAVNERAKYEPISVIIGADMVVEGLDDELEKMDVGDKKEVVIKPEKAFGERRGELIKTFSESKFKNNDMNPYPGMRVTVGQQVGRILSVNSGRVRVDMNHPLAGRTLEYEVEVKERIEGKKEKMKALAGYYLGTDTEVDIQDGKAVVEVPEGSNEKILEKIEEKAVEFFDIEDVSFEEKEDGSEEEDEKSK